MTDGSRFDWDQLADLWGTESATAELVVRLRRRVSRQAALRRAEQVGELLVLVGLAWLTRQYLGPDPSGPRLLVVGTAWAWAAALWGFSAWNRRQGLEAHAEGVVGYLVLLERYALARQRNARAVVPLSVVQCLIVLAMLYVAEDGTGSGRGALATGTAAVLVVVASVATWASWRFRVAARELKEVAETRRLMDLDRAGVGEEVR